MYYFLDMDGMFSPHNVITCLDDLGIDNAALGMELMKRKLLKYLLTENADTNVFHLEFLKVVRSHRGQDLGLKALDALLKGSE